MESSAKVAWFICSLSALLVTSGCKDKEARAEPEVPPAAPQLEKPPTVASAPAVPSTPPTPAPATPSPLAPASGLGIKVSPEQATSTVQVRIWAGALPPKSHVGALLHRDEVAEIPGMQGQSRCVLVHFAGWTREQLFNPACQFSVVRNQLGEGGELTTVNHVARLLQFDEKTQLAALSYQEKFDVSLDVGFHLDKAGAFAGSALALRHSRQAQKGSEMLLEPGRFTLKGNLAGVLESTPERPDNQRDQSPVVIVGNDTLVGFVSSAEAAGAASLVPINAFQLKVKAPVLKPVGIGFGKPSRDKLPIVIQVEPEDEQLIPERARLRVASVSTPADAQAAGEQSSGAFSAPIQTDDVKPLNAQGKREWRGSLAFPANDGEEVKYVLQLSWPSSSGSFSGEVFSHPFTVKLQNKSGSLVASVTGLKNLNEELAKSREATSHFPLEAEVLEFHEMAGGREVLIRLDGPPYWKRFSFTRNDWLPLPQVDFANAYLTGNLSALFVLDRGAATVRKYDLAELREIASVKLETGSEYLGLIAGCNTERAPIQVIAKKSALALSPETLQRRDSGRLDGRVEFNVQRASGYHVTGDGLAFIPFTNGEGASRGAFHYNSDTTGVTRELLDVKFYPTSERGTGVSSAFAIDQYSWLSTVATLDGEVRRTAAPQSPSGFSPRWLVPNAPVIFRLIRGKEDAIPPKPPYLECFSYFDTTPFAEVETPEWPGNLSGMEAVHWVAFDPYTLRLATLSLDRKQWIVHQITAAKDRAQPVLLNWPDTSLTRGGELRFKPVILGGTQFNVTMVGAQKSTNVVLKDEEIAVPIASDELASLLLLDLKVPGQNGDLTYSVPLHLFGPQPAFVSTYGESAPSGLASFATGFKSLATSKQNYLPVKSTLHAFADPVREIQGPMAGHLILVTTANRIDFFSLEARKVTRGIPAPANAVYFAGAEALFEYDLTTRTVSRINVPSGQRERAMTLPGDLSLRAFGVGAAASSPLTMLLEQTVTKDSERIGNGVVTFSTFKRDIVVLDNRTLQASGWAQPKRLASSYEDQTISKAGTYSAGNFGESAARLPTSYSGQVVTLPRYLLALGRTASFATAFPPESPGMGYDWQVGPSGSISGSIVANTRGATMVGGLGDGSNSNYGTSYVTPCGRYRLTKAGSTSEDTHYEVRTVENNRPILRLGRLSINRDTHTDTQEKIPWKLRPLGVNGPLTSLAGGGRALEVVDFDIPRLAKELNPTAFHVTSQAPAYMMSTVPMDYQIELNNPSAVATFRLRSPSPGVTVGPQGLVRYVASRVTQPTRVQIAVEIVGKDGQTVLHEFPIFVLP